MSTKDALVVAATRLLDEGGPERVTLRGVGQQAGVSHNAPYKHFADKTALLEAVAIAELRRTGVLFSRAGANPDPAAALRTAALAWVSWSVGHPARFRLVYGVWPETATALQAQADASWALFAELVQAAQAVGALPAGDTAGAVDNLRATMTGAVTLALGHHLGAGDQGKVGAERVVSGYLELLGQRA